MKETLILNGALLAQKKNDLLKKKLVVLPLQLSLATILVGDDPASHIYVQAKIKVAHEVGILSKAFFFDNKISEDELLNHIEKLNHDPGVHGILVQLPLPSHINPYTILATVDPKKDVDCFHPYNVGNLSTGVSDFAPATARGMMSLLDSITEQWIPESKHAVVIGASNIVGKPMAMLLLQKQATVTLAHQKTQDLKELCLQADLIVAAAGQANLISADMVSEGVVVLDVGIHRILDRNNGYRLIGDVDFDAVKLKSLAITPVPKGVGPMTISALLDNCYDLYCRSQRKSSPW
ncbi:MAG: bifunctional 5,10-methylenetetrahydrofolate dehydrogenase/5,10-methenyltetrahydrofolate cyclohydrolase [Brevinema sp.]